MTRSDENIEGIAGADPRGLRHGTPIPPIRTQLAEFMKSTRPTRSRRTTRLTGWRWDDALSVARSG